MKRQVCSVCGHSKSLLRGFLPGDTACVDCMLNKPMPPTIYDVRTNDHEFKLTFTGEPTTWEVFQRIYGERELATSAILETLVWPGAHVLELGACFGYFTLQLSQLVGAAGRVVAVEAKDSYYALLHHNLRLNKVANVWDTNVFIHSDADWKSKYRGERAPAIAATTFVKQAFPDSAPDLIFMDIEGYEHDAITDLCESGWLAQAKPHLLWEIHGRIDEGDPDNDAIIGSLRKVGYHIHRARKMNIGIHGSKI